MRVETEGEGEIRAYGDARVEFCLERLVCGRGAAFVSTRYSNAFEEQVETKAALRPPTGRSRQSLAALCFYPYRVCSLDGTFVCAVH